MTGLAARTGGSLRLVRTAIELAVFAGGWALGGEPGIGTAVFALTIGPIVQFSLHWLGMWVAPPPEDITRGARHLPLDQPWEIARDS
jgi:uncharacterized membrane protein YczE